MTTRAGEDIEMEKQMGSKVRGALQNMMKPSG